MADNPTEMPRRETVPTPPSPSWAVNLTVRHAEARLGVIVTSRFGYPASNFSTAELALAISFPPRASSPMGA
jgi:hypothetical protein